MRMMVCAIPFKVTDGTEDFGPFGNTKAIEAVVTLNTKCSPEQREATLVHEWCHAVLMCNGVSHDEPVVACLATELYRAGFRVKTED
jgi:hypothetical protein